MKIQFQIRGVNINTNARNRLKESLRRLQRLISISAAAVVLEHRWDNVPAFRAFVSLAIPGPDIHDEARDHTLNAAWLKVTTALRKQIERRKAKQLARIKSNRNQTIFAAPCSRGGLAK